MSTSEIKPEKNSSTYLITADVIRVIATIAVVSIHLLNPIYARPDFFGGTIWWVSFLLNCLFRVSVPLFLMLSGYLLLDRELSFRQVLTRLWQRIVIPLISFYIIITAFNVWAAWMRGEEYAYYSIITNLYQSTGTHLYFLVGLSWCYLFISPIQTFFKSHTAKAQQIATYVLLSLAILITLLKYLFIPQLNLTSTFIIGSMWLGYFMFGHIAKKYLVPFNQLLLFLAFVLSFIYTVITGYYQLQLHHSGDNRFYSGFVTYAEEFLSVGVVVMSITMFLLLIQLKLPRPIQNSQMFANSISFLSKVSFGVYLTHIMVMDFYHKFLGITADNPSIQNLGVYLLLSFFTTFITTGLVAFFLRRFTFSRWLVGV